MKARAVLLDLDGTLYVGGTPIAGATAALRALRERGLALRFLTNTTRRSRHGLAEWLHERGFDIATEDLFTAPVAAAHALRAMGIERIALYLPGAAHEDFHAFTRVDEKPDAIVVGDLAHGWDFDTLNRAFRQLLDGARFIALQKNRFWRTEDGLSLDAGPFVAALEFASGTPAHLIGKPSRDFFRLAAASLDTSPADVVVVGDDVETDIAGAQQAGLRGVLVRTGKFRADIVERANARPDAVVDSIADLPALLAALD